MKLKSKCFRINWPSHMQNAWQRTIRKNSEYPVIVKPQWNDRNMLRAFAHHIANLIWQGHFRTGSSTPWCSEGKQITLRHFTCISFLQSAALLTKRWKESQALPSLLFDLTWCFWAVKRWEQQHLHHLHFSYRCVEFSISDFNKTGRQNCDGVYRPKKTDNLFLSTFERRKMWRFLWTWF